MGRVKPDTPDRIDVATLIIAKIGPAAIHGIHWHYGPPPIVGIEIEIDIRAIQHELRL